MIRKAKIEDCETLYKINCEIFSSPFQLDYFIQAVDRENNVTIFVNEVNNIIVSYLAAWEDNNFSHITSLATLKTERNKGYASNLIEYYISTLANNNFISCVLDVRQSNQEAISLYNKFNFLPYHTAINFYDNGESAIQMIKNFKKEVN